MDKFNLNFGLLIAYIVPGFLGLYAVSEHSTVIENLLGGSTNTPTTGAIVPLLLLALASGVVINAITWILVRPMIEFTGVKRPHLRYGKISKELLDVYNEAIESSYRYYQSYGNLFAILLMIGFNSLISSTLPNLHLVIIYLAVLLILFFAARDSLNRSYQQMSDILDQTGENEMTNGNPRTSPVNQKAQEEKIDTQQKEDESTNNSERTESKEHQEQANKAQHLAQIEEDNQ